MTQVDLWQNTLQYGALFLLCVAVVMFLRGDLVSGAISRHAQEREIDARDQAHKEALQALKERYDEMQAVWRERYTELAKDRDYFRVLSAQLAQQTEQAISTQEVSIRGMPGAQRSQG